MKTREFAIHLARGLCVLLVAYATHGVVYADGGITCERLIGVSLTSGVVKDTGLCMPDDCTGTPHTCREWTFFITVPPTHICNCDGTGKACTVAYVGDSSGQGGSTYCYNNSCSVACPQPTITSQRFSTGGVVYNVLSCGCPQ